MDRDGVRKDDGEVLEVREGAGYQNEKIGGGEAALPCDEGVTP
jgi:hypothetical protein